VGEELTQWETADLNRSSPETAQAATNRRLMLRPQLGERLAGRMMRAMRKTIAWR